MDETWMLLLLVLVMLVGSYVAGNIPLIFSLSEEKLKGITVFGAGLLVGTALTVIIPEGIRALYEESNHHDTDESQDIPIEHTLNSQNTGGLHEIAAAHSGHGHHHSAEHSSTIGMSLVLGFIFMMIVDQISSRRSKGASNMIATIGLVVHAAADGVALGAAATTNHHDVEIIVFLAIMLHKAPAAFGLVGFLLHEGIDRQTIRKHLGIFSMSAPLLTLLTYFCIGQEGKETLNNLNATGIAMLFSAGTFLYVATVHVLPELTHSNRPHSHGMSTSSSVSSSAGFGHSHLEQPLTGKSSYTGLRNMELFILICGALLPVFLSAGHHH